MRKVSKEKGAKSTERQTSSAMNLRNAGAGVQGKGKSCKRNRNPHLGPLTEQK